MWEDDLEEYQAVSRAELEYYRREVEKYRDSKRAVVLDVRRICIGRCRIVQVEP